MIKVNLISVTPGQAPAREWFPKEQRSALLGVVLLMTTALGVSGWWFYLYHERHNVEAAVASAEVELARLKEVAQAVDRARARKTELAERLDLIEHLRTTMHGPVHLLQTVSESVPHGLWLLEIKQAGATVQMDGRAMSLTPVTDFAKQIDDTHFFTAPVEIVTSSEILEETPVIRFTMKGDVAAPSPTSVKASATTPAPAPSPVPSAGVPAPTPEPPAAAPASPMSPEALPVPPGAPPKTQIAAVRSSGGR